MLTTFDKNDFTFRKIMKVLTVWCVYFFFFKCTLFSQFIFDLIGQTNYNVLDLSDCSFPFVVFSIGIVFYFASIAIELLGFKGITNKYQIEDTVNIVCYKAEQTVFCLDLSNPFLYATKVFGLLE